MKFVKMQGTGNDFIITENIEFEKEEIIKLCDRHFGIGADGVLNLYNHRHLTIYNSDGNKAKMCGNGLRCIGIYLYNKTQKTKFEIEIGKELTTLEVNPETSEVTVFFSRPNFINHKLAKYVGNFIDTGNSHFMMLVDDISTFPLEKVAREIQETTNVNVEICEKISDTNIKLRIYEYGVGETKSCGSGALATFFSLNQFKMVKNEITVEVKGGTLIVGKKANSYYVKGPASEIFKGECDDEI